jgi:hypothetical protein
MLPIHTINSVIIEAGYTSWRERERERERESLNARWSTVLITALGSWETLPPLGHISQAISK